MGPGSSGEVTKGRQDWANAAWRQRLQDLARPGAKCLRRAQRWDPNEVLLIPIPSSALVFPMPAAPPAQNPSLPPPPSKPNHRSLGWQPSSLARTGTCPPPAPPTPSTPAKEWFIFTFTSSTFPLGWHAAHQCIFLHWKYSSLVQSVCLNPALIHSNTEPPLCQVHVRGHLSGRKENSILLLPGIHTWSSSFPPVFPRPITPCMCYNPDLIASSLVTSEQET